MKTVGTVTKPIDNLYQNVAQAVVERYPLVQSVNMDVNSDVQEITNLLFPEENRARTLHVSVCRVYI